MSKRRSWAVIVVLVLAAACPFTVDAKGKPLWRFRVVDSGKVTGRYDFGVVHREGTVYAVSAFYAGEKALDPKHRKKIRPTRRSYAELVEPGVLGKYKRWDVHKGVERYWMTFTYKGKVKVRYEKGPGARGEVSEIGDAEAVAPLDGGQPQFAFMLAKKGESGREVACAGVVPKAFGKATVVFSGPEEIKDPNATETTVRVDRWDVIGDCGSYKVFIEGTGRPLLITSGDVRYEMIVKKAAGKPSEPKPSGG